MNLIYSQSLAWFGIFYSPLLPVVQLIKLFLVFYLKKLTVLKFSSPFKKVTPRTMLYYIIALGAVFWTWCCPKCFIVCHGIWPREKSYNCNLSSPQLSSPTIVICHHHVLMFLMPLPLRPGVEPVFRPSSWSCYSSGLWPPPSSLLVAFIWQRHLQIVDHIEWVIRLVIIFQLLVSACGWLEPFLVATL